MALKVDQIQKWEIAGVSVYPVVEALLALDVPEALGLDDAQLLHAAIACFTIAAVVRAVAAAKR